MGPTLSTRRCWPTPSGWRCSSYWKRSPQRSGSRTSCTTCSQCRSTRSRRSLAARQGRYVSSRRLRRPTRHNRRLERQHPRRDRPRKPGQGAYYRVVAQLDPTAASRSWRRSRCSPDPNGRPGARSRCSHCAATCSCDDSADRPESRRTRRRLDRAPVATDAPAGSARPLTRTGGTPTRSHPTPSLRPSSRAQGVLIGPPWLTGGHGGHLGCPPCPPAQEVPRSRPAIAYALVAGWMFWFTRKMFSGSYCALTPARRS